MLDVSKLPIDAQRIFYRAEALRRIRALGDLPGHPFRGNQWTGSLGDILAGDKLSGAKGTNPGGTYQTKSGHKFYVKQYSDPTQAHGEHLANAIYHELGIGAPKSQVGESGGKTYYASQYMEGKGTIQDVGLSKHTADQVLEGFAADAFLGNWDAVGTGMDNVLVSGHGVSRIDNGGALLHRAQGALKSESLLGKVGEWQTLADRNYAPYYAKVFSKAGLKNADELGEKAVKQIDKIVALKEKVGGWTRFVNKTIPGAPASYRAKVAKMLDARTEDLAGIRARIAKRAEIKAAEFDESKHPRVPAGQPGGGQFQSLTPEQQHELDKQTYLSPGEAGKLPPGIVKWKIQQAKAKAALKDLKAGATPEQILQKYGLTEKDLEKHAAKVNETKEKIKKALAEKKAKFEAEKLALVKPKTWNEMTADERLALAQKEGYQWKQKTFGPNTGKYAWFYPNGTQQASSFGESSEAKAKLDSINYGKGIEPPAPAVKMKPGEWPIDDSVERAMGSNYPTKVSAKYASWAKNLDSDERSAIFDYTGSGYGSMNNALRNNYTVDSWTQKRIDNVSSALKKAPSPPPPDLVWRGISNSASFAEKLKPGNVVEMKGFQSTTINPEFAHSWGDSNIIFEIKPASGAYVKILSDHPTEYEYLLPHNAKYTVKGIREVKFKGSYGYHPKVRVLQLEMHK